MRQKNSKQLRVRGHILATALLATLRISPTTSPTTKKSPRSIRRQIADRHAARRKCDRRPLHGLRRCQPNYRSRRLTRFPKNATLPCPSIISSIASPTPNFDRLGLFPSDLCTDAEFLRRTSLDTIGVLPTPDEVRAFLADSNTGKRARWIEHLLDHPAYADYWANKWADLIRPNPDRVGVKSIFFLDQWVRESFRANKPYDQFVREILTAEGSNHQTGPMTVYRDRREPPDLTTMFSQLFLGVRMECAKCHHHPNEKWSQDDFYQFAAYFGPLKQKGAGLSPPISAGTESSISRPAAR